MSRSTRLATTAACLTAVVCAPATPAFAIGGGSNPAATPPKFPGTSTVVHGWKLSGTQFATQVQVAPRWLVGSAHSPLGVGQTYTSPTGVKSKVIAELHPTQAATPNGTRGADISINLLETPIPAPPGGFPYLLTEQPSKELSSVLPGYTFWAGKNGAEAIVPVPNVGWARADGTAVSSTSPAIFIDGGDSGSTGLHYRTSTARPLMTGPVLVGTGGALPTFGTGTRIADPLYPRGDETYQTVEAWMKGSFAKHPGAPAPDFATFAAAGITYSSLKPPGVGDLKVSSATATSVSLSWSLPTEKRVPRTGFRVRNTTTGALATLPATATSHTFTGLRAGTAYAFSVKAYNANGDSPSSATVGPNTVSYKVRTLPVAPADLTVTPIRANGANTRGYGGSGNAGVDYCLEAKWSPVTPPSGATITHYASSIGGVGTSPTFPLGSPDPSIVPGADGKLTARRCGLNPATGYTVKVVAHSEKTIGTEATKAGTTSAGAPLGTPFGAPANLRTEQRVTSNNDGVDRCATVSWDAPAPLAGFTPVGYTLLVRTGDSSVIKPFNNLGADVRSRDMCGLPADDDFFVTATVRYDAEGTQAASESQFTTSLGAPTGTSIPKPTNVVAEARMENKAGKVDRCVRADWDPPVDLDGFPLVDYQVLIYSTDYAFVEGTNGIATGPSRRNWERCDLPADKDYVVTIYSRFSTGESSTINSKVEKTATTPAGAPNGTPWELSRSVSVSHRTVAGQRCSTIAWDAPLPVDGFPVTGYGVLLRAADHSYIAASTTLAPSARSYERCGVPASRNLTADVYVTYAPAVSLATTLAFTTPA